ncbi:MAG: ribose-phosphate pyrophosphokinase [Phycisphaerales bacterium]|nr:MAG: ribose-phosphate pyrophosphokinase [Phycisphaerales bacterium]
MRDLKVFAGSASHELTRMIRQYLGIGAGEVAVTPFPDGETFLKLQDDVRGKDCFIVQSTCPPVNDNLMELLIFIDSLRRASASRITAVIPYFGYARQDRKSEGRTPITAKLVANLICAAGANRVLAMNLHAEQIQGFFDIPVDHLTAVPVVAEHFEQLNLPNPVVVSPDVGNLKTANQYTARLHGDIAIIDKRRRDGDSIEAVNIIGDVAGKTVLLFDDMITTAGTVCGAAHLVREHGAKKVYVGATHAVLAGPACKRLKEAGFEQICVTNTIPLRDSCRSELGNIQVLSVADLFGEAIRRIHRHESVSALFDEA